MREVTLELDDDEEYLLERIFERIIEKKFVQMCIYNDSYKVVDKNGVPLGHNDKVVDIENRELVVSCENVRPDLLNSKGEHNLVHILPIYKLINITKI